MLQRLLDADVCPEREHGHTRRDKRGVFAALESGEATPQMTLGGRGGRGVLLPKCVFFLDTYVFKVSPKSLHSPLLPWKVSKRESPSSICKYFQLLFSITFSHTLASV